MRRERSATEGAESPLAPAPAAGDEERREARAEGNLAAGEDESAGDSGRTADAAAAAMPTGDGGAAGSGAAAAAALLPEQWRVRLPVFEGPLDLLLHLIKVNRVEITDIPVVTICEQFHAYLGLMEELNLDIAGEYIYEAALLIHLKSKLLLPRAPVKEGEVEEDPRQELVERLLEYRRLKEVAQSLAEVDRLRGGVWKRRPQPLPLAPPVEEEVDLGEVSLFDLLSALRQAMNRYDREHPPPFQVSAEAFSVREQFDRLLAALDAGRPFDLVADLRRRSCRAEAIAAFLAVLELARLNLIRVHQTGSGEILVYRTTRELAADEREAIGA
jgi:segregation and condensation protein A